MAIRNLVRAASMRGFATPTAAPIRIDTVTNTPFYNGTGSGSTEIELVDVSSVQTFTNKTLTSPTINTPTISGGTMSGIIDSDFKVLASNASFSAVSVLTSLTGMAWNLVAGATYVFEINLPCSMTTNGGLTVAFKYSNSLTLTSIAVNTYQSTATDNATAVSSQSTTTADQTAWVDNKTAAYTLTRIVGSLVVNAAGQLQLQAKQNTSNSDTTTINAGSYAYFTRVL